MGGYTLAEMISYYLVVNVVDALTAVTEDDWQIAADIKDGNISQFLLKPIDYLRYRLCLFAAGRMVYTPWPRSSRRRCSCCSSASILRGRLPG